MFALLRLISLCALLISAVASGASMYEQELPPGLSTDANMCQWVDCASVLPGANRFSARMGRPPYVEAYQGQQLKGYVFLSTDIVDITGYSGKPIVTLIGMNTHGIITGVRVLKHSEPILLVGIPESKLLAYLKQYQGLFAGTRFEIGKNADNNSGLDAISGATVTVIAENQAIARCAYVIATQVGIVKQKARPAAKLIPLTQGENWQALLDDGSVQHLSLKPSDVGMPDSASPYLDLYYGYLNAPAIGRSILGDAGYQDLMQSLKPGEHALFIVSSGTESFKGSGFVRGGIFDRIQVKQDLDSFTFRDTDYTNLYSVKAQGAPEFKESGIFVIRNPTFSAAYPWQFVFLGNKVDRQTGAKVFSAFESQYWLPAKFLQGGRPVVAMELPAWEKIWRDKALEIALFCAWLILVTGFFVSRDVWVRKAKRSQKQWVSWPKMISWIFAIGFVGWHEMAQPSITQVLTLFNSLGSGWNWSLFLLDPFIFLFWCFIAVTVLIWGRGLFCGWMCPFGSLSEILYKAAGALGLRRFQGKLPARWHARLKWLKYVIFAVLLLTSFYSISSAEALAEIEPFKTTFLVGVLNRAWPFVLFWTVIVGVSLFTERPFCKYLCPLGAGLAIPSWLRMLPLRRKAGCTTCHACAVGCGSQAIDEQGRIDQKECLMCLDCMVMYYDEHSCPPLSQERKRRLKAGLPLSRVDKGGHYIPIKPL